MSKKELTIIGRAERIDFPDLDLSKIPAKVDSGADLSSIWVSSVTESEGKLICLFFGEGSPYYTGKPVVFEKKEYTLTRVANSFGHKELRYKLKLRVTVHNRTIKASFTLSDRSKKLYPVLLGRKLLSGKFLIDVSGGEPLLEEEKEKKKNLKKVINQVEAKRRQS